MIRKVEWTIEYSNQIINILKKVRYSVDKDWMEYLFIWITMKAIASFDRNF